MADYGAGVSQKGYDVKTCADRFLVYSSAFPVLKILSVSSVTTTIPASGTNTITITHNLGYFAPFIVVYNGSTTRGVTSSYLMQEDFGIPLDYRTVGMYTDTLKIWVGDAFDSYESATGDTVYFTVYIFLDDFSTLSNSVINTGTTSGASSTDYGFRISKSGYDVKTCTNEQCILSSSFFTQIIQKKGSTASGSTTHGLGYPPAMLVYLKRSGATFISYPTLTGAADSTNVYFPVATGDTAYYVIFKSKNG